MGTASPQASCPGGQLVLAQVVRGDSWPEDNTYRGKPALDVLYDPTPADSNCASASESRSSLAWVHVATVVHCVTGDRLWKGSYEL